MLSESWRVWKTDPPGGIKEGRVPPVLSLERPWVHAITWAFKAHLSPDLQAYLEVTGMLCPWPESSWLWDADGDHIWWPGPQDLTAMR